MPSGNHHIHFILLPIVEFIEIFNDNTHEYDKFIVNLVTVKCRLISGTSKASEHSKIIWLKRENLHSLKWGPADVPAVDQLVAEDKKGIAEGF